MIFWGHVHGQECRRTHCADKTETRKARSTPQRPRTKIKIRKPQTRHAPQNHRRRRAHHPNGKRPGICRDHPPKFSPPPSGVRMTARPLPICLASPPVSPARRLLKRAAALPHLPHTFLASPVAPPAQPSMTPPPPRVQSPLFTPRSDTQPPPADPLPPISTISPVCLAGKVNRSAKTRNL